MKLNELISAVHTMMADSFPLYEIKHYSFNQTPVDENDYHKCVIEISKVMETGESRQSIFVLFNGDDKSTEVAFTKNYNNSKYQQFVKMHLFESAQKIIVVEWGKKLSYFDISNYVAGKQIDFGGSSSVSGVTMCSFRKVVYRENTWGEIIKSNLPEYIGMLSDDDSFVIINIKTWTMVEMIKDILPMLEIENFSIYKNTANSKKIFVVLRVRGEFPDYQRSRVSVWDINLDPEGNYGMFRGTYAVEGFISQSAYFLEKRFVVEVKAHERTNFLNFK